MPYAQTIGSVPVVAECLNQAVTVKSLSSTRRDGEQTRRRATRRTLASAFVPSPPR